jgi:Polyketide cyclase / dehydrase and lipid transport
MDRTFVIESHRVTSSGPDEVMSLILDPASWSSWQSEIVVAEGPKQAGSGSVARGRARLLGFAVHGHSTAVEVEPATYDHDVIVGVRMRVRYRVDETENGTLITHRMSADLPGGLSGRLLSLFLRGRLRRLQKRALANLARRSETLGERQGT